MIDLHVHTTCSDGRQTPTEVVDRAIAVGLEAIAITDHDTLAGYLQARDGAAGRVALIAGVEVSAAEARSAIHILGYGIDPHSAILADALAGIERQRRVRAAEIVERLNGMGLGLTMEMVGRVAAGAPITRAHIAQALVGNGLLRTHGSAFSRYLSDSSPAFVPHDLSGPAEAIDLVHRAGGVAVLAHPGLTRRDELIAGMIRAGLDGIEIVHPYHTPAMVRFYRQLADKHDLLATGGSDAHGTSSLDDRMGTIGMASSLFGQIEEAIAHRCNSRARGATAAAPTA